MWRETKILLIDDDAARRSGLAVILDFLDENYLSCSSADWRKQADSLASSRDALCVVLGQVDSKGGATELAKILGVGRLFAGAAARRSWP